jgi:hypothetical protein
MRNARVYLTIGITRIFPPSIVSVHGCLCDPRYIALRPGDGLRGPLVIYDPDDPHQDLYDIDDGLYLCFHI